MELKEIRELISREELQQLTEEIRRYTAAASDNFVSNSVRSSLGADLRYALNPNELITGRPQDAARGINFYCKVPDSQVHEQMVYGLASIRREFADHGTEEDNECLDYILNHPAGSSDRIFPNGVRDRGRKGELFSDFVQHPSSVESGLSAAHVLALRLYTSAAYKSINQPLRDHERCGPHPFPVTVNLITEGLKRLRTIGAQDQDAHSLRNLWRGMRNLQMTDAFTEQGGTEIAPMSATSDLCIALRYALSSHSLLFKIVTNSFMERGVDLSYLSCFPEEAEHLFAPLTYLRPTGCTQSIEHDGVMLYVVEVVPIFGA